MSGFCKKASRFKGLNNPDFLRLFSTTLAISNPTSSIFRTFLNSFREVLSTDKDEIAIGNGLRLPLVMSTFIRALASVSYTHLTLPTICSV